jgi:hypothetical protein
VEQTLAMVGMPRILSMPLIFSLNPSLALMPMELHPITVYNI